MLKRAAKVDMTFVPVSRHPPTINALLGDHVTAVIVGYAEAAEHLKTGQAARPGDRHPARVEALPDVPT